MVHRLHSSQRLHLRAEKRITVLLNFLALFGSVVSGHFLEQMLAERVVQLIPLMFLILSLLRSRKMIMIILLLLL